jgi:hypothetical protein
MTNPTAQLVKGKYGHSRGDVGDKFDNGAIQIKSLTHLNTQLKK